MSQKKSHSVVEDSLKKIFREYSEALLIAIVIAVLVRTFILSAYKIPTESMFPTLRVGDFIVGSKLSYGFKLPFTDGKVFFASAPKRGDVVIFKCLKSGFGECIKRVVALPGDRVQIIKKNLIINNKKAEYQSLPRKSSVKVSIIEKIGRSQRVISITQDRELDDYGPVVVPPGHFFVLGDSRDEAEDSRIMGVIPYSKLRAKALFVWISLDWSSGWTQKGPVKDRWDRIFTKVN